MASRDGPERSVQALVNDEMVDLRPGTAEALEDIRRLRERHVRFSGSVHAQDLLDRWHLTRRDFLTVQPQGARLAEPSPVEAVAAPAA